MITKQLSASRFCQRDFALLRKRHHSAQKHESFPKAEHPFSSCLGSFNALSRVPLVSPGDQFGIVPIGFPNTVSRISAEKAWMWGASGSLTVRFLRRQRGENAHWRYLLEMKFNTVGEERN